MHDRAAVVRLRCHGFNRRPRRPPARAAARRLFAFRSAGRDAVSPCLATPRVPAENRESGGPAGPPERVRVDQFSDVANEREGATREVSATMVRRPPACINKCSFYRSQNDLWDAPRAEIAMHRHAVESKSSTRTTRSDHLRSRLKPAHQRRTFVIVGITRRCVGLPRLAMSDGIHATPHSPRAAARRLFAFRPAGRTPIRRLPRPPSSG